MMKIKPDFLEKLVGHRQYSRGFQFAHIVGQSFYTSPAMSWAAPLFGGDVDDPTNIVVLPEGERGNAILGVAAHVDAHNTVFD